MKRNTDSSLSSVFSKECYHCPVRLRNRRTLSQPSTAGVFVFGRGAAMSMPAATSQRSSHVNFKATSVRWLFGL